MHIPSLISTKGAVGCFKALSFEYQIQPPSPGKQNQGSVNRLQAHCLWEKQPITGGSGGLGKRESRWGGYLAVIRSASTSSPMPSTSTTRASSYFFTVLEHKVTWKGKGEKRLFCKASPPPTQGGKEQRRTTRGVRLLSTLLWDVWHFTFLAEQVTFRVQGLLSFFKGQVRNQMAFGTIGLLISEKTVSKKSYTCIRGKITWRMSHIKQTLITQFKLFSMPLGSVNYENSIHQ